VINMSADDSTRSRNRVTPMGQQLGERMSRMTDTECGKLVAEGEWEKDERCASCAFRHGTIPNGCPQTQMDVLKSVLERKTFMCHVARDGREAGQHTCMGWFAAMQAAKKKPPVECPWPFSKPD
jgi:hypothetical protein